MRNSSPKPSMRFSITWSKASGVTSRPVIPVPPVVITTSISGSAIQRRSRASIAAVSSFSIARAAILCPALTMRSARVSPDVSLAAVRVSDTVRTAMLTGMKGRLSSRRAMDRASGWSCAGSVQARHQEGHFALMIKWREAGKLAGGQIVEAGRRQMHAGRVDPGISQDVGDEATCFRNRNGFDEQQRVVVVVNVRAPTQKIAGTGIIAGQHADQIVVDAVLPRQVGDVVLADLKVR